MPALFHVWNSLCNLSRPFSLGSTFPTSTSSQNVPACSCFPPRELWDCVRTSRESGHSASGIQGPRWHFRSITVRRIPRVLFILLAFCVVSFHSFPKSFPHFHTGSQRDYSLFLHFRVITFYIKNPKKTICSSSSNGSIRQIIQIISRIIINQSARWLIHKKDANWKQTEESKKEFFFFTVFWKCILLKHLKDILLTFLLNFFTCAILILTLQLDTFSSLDWIRITFLVLIGFILSFSLVCVRFIWKINRQINNLKGWEVKIVELIQVMWTAFTDLLCT